jgi:hypothetical protein
MLNGQQTQQIGNVLPIFDAHGERRDPLFGQVYVIDDPVVAADIRLRTAPAGDRLRRDVMQALDTIILQHNPFARRLMTLGQLLERAARGEEAGLPPPQHFRLSILDNRPAPGQVFALFDTRDNTPPDPNLSGIWITTEGNRLQKIATGNRNADWIIFPLMFPAATQTYGRGILRKNLLGPASIPSDDQEMLEMVDRGEEIAASAEPFPPEIDALPRAPPNGIYLFIIITLAS